jgi:RyR domain
MGQRRVHVVIVGFGPLALHLAPQIIRTNLGAGFEIPAVTILCPQPDEARNALHLAYPGIESVAKLTILPHQPLARPLDEASPLGDGSLMDKVDKAGPVTAVVAIGEGGFEAIPNALAVREATRRTGRWRVPVFFAVDSRESFEGIDHPRKGTKHYSKVLQTFDVSAALWRVRHTEDRDRIAHAIHARFLRAQRADRARGKDPTGTNALLEWEDLPLTYRQASRRASDHVPAKIVSAGCIMPERSIILSADVTQIANSPMFEGLSVLEHDAWATDRRLDGWRPGPVRDDPSRVHDMLVPYDQLTEPVKDLDRDQIRDLFAETLPRVLHEPAPQAVRFDLWIGLIGTTNVARADTARLVNEVAEAISRIVEARPNHYITLLSPLAPGSDLIATRKALAILAAAYRPHRLLVPNAVHFSQVVKSFEARWRAGAVADLDIAAGGDWHTAHDRILTPCRRSRPCRSASGCSNSTACRSRPTRNSASKVTACRMPTSSSAPMCSSPPSREAVYPRRAARWKPLCGGELRRQFRKSFAFIANGLTRSAPAYSTWLRSIWGELDDHPTAQPRSAASCIAKRSHVGFVLPINNL